MIQTIRGQCHGVMGSSQNMVFGPESL